MDNRVPLLDAKPLLEMVTTRVCPTLCDTSMSLGAPEAPCYSAEMSPSTPGHPEMLPTPPSHTLHFPAADFSSTRHSAQEKPKGAWKANYWAYHTCSFF